MLLTTHCVPESPRLSWGEGVGDKPWATLVCLAGGALGVPVCSPWTHHIIILLFSPRMMALQGRRAVPPFRFLSYPQDFCPQWVA